MNKLWAPWREAYFSSRKTKGCFLCRIARSRSDRVHLVISRSRHSFAVLNLYPYNNGHTMIVPTAHVKNWFGLSRAESADFLGLLDQTVRRIEKILKPEGLNIGINLGRASGAGAPGHLHVHIVPRWQGDTNFLPVLSETKVISESLKSVYRKLAAPKREFR